MRIDDLGNVIFKADEPDYVPDAGMAGKGSWFVLVVGPGLANVHAAFGPFPSDEDALEFAHGFPKNAFCWTVSQLTDPRDQLATGRKLVDLMEGVIRP
jgi:hypothetical protein